MADQTTPDPPDASPKQRRAPRASRAAGGKRRAAKPSAGRRADDRAADLDASAEEPAAAEERPAAEVAPQPDVLVSRAGRVALVELSGYGDGQVTPLRLAPGERALIGRMGDDLTLRLGNDQWVSARHAQVWQDENGWWLEDLRSRNGTVLLDTQTQLDALSPTRLTMGSMFRVGHTDLMLTNDTGIMRETAEGA